MLGRSGYKPQARKVVRSSPDYSMQENMYSFIRQVYCNEAEQQTRKEEELANLIRNYKNRKQDVDTLAWLSKSEVVERLSAHGPIDKTEVIQFVQEAQKVFRIPPRQIVDMLDQVQGNFKGFLNMALESSVPRRVNPYDDHLIKKVKRRK